MNKKWKNNLFGLLVIIVLIICFIVLIDIFRSYKQAYPPGDYDLTKFKKYALIIRQEL